MELSALEQVLDVLQTGKHIVFVSVLTRTGSTPAPLNAFLIVDSTRARGTIGGGMLEAEALSRAREILETRDGTTLTLSMTGESAAEQGMLCGGSVKLLFEAIQPADLQCWASAADTLQSGGHGLFVVRVEVDADRTTISRNWVTSDGIAGLTTLRNEAEEALDRGIQRTLTRSGATYLLDPVVLPDVLLVFGAGHVAQALVPVAASVGFRCWVIDDREMFASRERFPQAYRMLVAPPSSAPQSLPFGSRVWAVVMTRGHKDDADVLKELCLRDYRYIGMIGSKRKKDITFRDLEAEGIPAEIVQAVHCPIGLPLGGSSPAEIAISIAAELIAVRHERRTAF
jgi:xanthine dehydrogenase accessory factor